MYARLDGANLKAANLDGANLQLASMNQAQMQFARYSIDLMKTGVLKVSVLIRTITLYCMLLHETLTKLLA